MPSRNTEVLKKIRQTLEIEDPDLLSRLENHFKSFLRVLAATETDVTRYAEELRLAVIEQERRPVLDYIQQKGLRNITIDQVEEAINTLFPGRFIKA